MYLTKWSAISSESESFLWHGLRLLVFFLRQEKQRKIKIQAS